MNEIKGLGIALVTPFKTDNSVDFTALERLINRCVNGGVDYLVSQGTTGESATLTMAEKQEVLRFTKEVLNHRLPLVLGHGGNNTQGLIDGFGSFDWSGVSACLSASPYYNKPTQQGIFAHYSAFAKACPVPVILYNVPGRTASNVRAETTRALAKSQKNIVAIKEASGDLDQMGQLLKNRPEDFVVLSGDDNLVLSQLAIGADGVISVIGNALPKEFSDLVHLGLKGDMRAARQRNFQLMDIIPLLFQDGNPAGVKSAMEMMGIMSEKVRLPLVETTNATKKELYDALSQAGIQMD